MNHGNVFQKLKARYCLAAILIAWYWQPGSHLLTKYLIGPEWYWPDVAFHYYAHVTIALFLFIAVRVTRLQVTDVIGRVLTRHDLRPTLFVVILTFSASITITTITYVPLSYLLPNFVGWWLIWSFQPVVYLASDGSFPVAANTLNFVSLVILAPLLEELLFRGYLLHRWTKKWGLPTGVLLSSAVFGAIHPDPLAIAVIGTGFAALYLKTQSLWAPIVAHAFYNLIVWVWDFFGVVSEGLDYYTYAIDQLRDDWWFGAIALVIVVLLIDRLLRRNKPLGPFRLPSSLRAIPD